MERFPMIFNFFRYKKIKKGLYSFPSPYWDGISEEAKDLVQRLLTVDPLKRAKAIDVKNHPWITSNSTRDVDLGKNFQNQLKNHQMKVVLKRGVNTVLAGKFTSGVFFSIQQNEFFFSFTDGRASTVTNVYLFLFHSEFLFL